MFSRFFSGKQYTSRTGVFKIQNRVLIEIDKVPGIGSINDYINDIGFAGNQIHVVINLNSKKISHLGFKIFTKEPILVFTKKENQKISVSDVGNAVKSIDWNSEYSTLNTDGFLDMGIDYGNLSLEFLKSVIELKQEDSKLYKSEQLGLYLQFNENKMLESFSSAGWDNSSTRWLRSFNEEMVRNYIKEADKYHDNERDLMKEVNNQTDALMKIPNAVNNEYANLHRYGNVIHFYNLLLVHYSKTCTKADFLFMNKGRFIEIDSKNYQVGEFIYTFDGNDELKDVSPG